MKQERLEKYNQKRHFKATSEPPGVKSKKQKAKKDNLEERIFVVQKHNASRLHYDLRLEIDGTLASWAVPKGPSRDPKVRRLAMHVEDHPMDYATFEGVIPKGEYGAGQIVVWDYGSWKPVEPGDPAKYEKAGQLKFEIFGKKLKGIWNLVRFKTEDEGDTWLLIKDRDEFSRSEDDDETFLNKKPESVLSKNTLARLAKPSKEARAR